MGHTSGGDGEKERLCMMPILLAVHTTSRAHHTSLVPFHSTAATAGLHSRPDSVVASAEQASEPRAGLRMVHSTYRKDLRAGVASPADQLAPAILLPSHHASESTAERRQCALGADRQTDSLFGPGPAPPTTFSHAAPPASWLTVRVATRLRARPASTARPSTSSKSGRPARAGRTSRRCSAVWCG